MSEPYHARCTEETAMRMIDGEKPYEPVPVPFFQAALGIRLIVTENVPEGRIQIWDGNKMVKEMVL